MDLDPDLSAKEQRIKKAVTLYYGRENMTHQEVADELNLARETVTGYLNSNDAKKFKRYFADRERYELRAWLENRIQGNQTRILSEMWNIMTNPEADEGDRIRAARTIMKADKDLGDILRELGVLEKVPDRMEADIEERKTTTVFKVDTSDFPSPDGLKVEKDKKEVEE